MKRPVVVAALTVLASTAVFASGPAGAAPAAGLSGQVAYTFMPRDLSRPA